MAYVNLDLPDSLPDSVRTVGVEPLLQDVHWMLATNIGNAEEHGPPRQLQVPIAHTLLATVAGVSTQLYRGPGETGERFRNCLASFFPWDIDPPKGVSMEEAGKILYDVFRNPLVHSLGLHKASGPVVKIGQVFRGTADAETRVTVKPYSDPCLVVTPEKRVLWLDSFYWGVRKLVEPWSRDANEVLHADQKLTRHLKRPRKC